MRQLRRPGHDIADRVDARLTGPLVAVDLDEPAVGLHLGVFQPDVLRVRRASNRHKQLVRFDRVLLAVGERGGDAYALADFVHLLDLRAGLDANAGLLEDALEFLGDLFVFHGHDARQHLEDGDLRPHAVEDRGELHAHRAGADDRQRFRHRRHVQDLDVGEDVAIGLQPGKHLRFGTCGEDDVFRVERLRPLVGADLDLAAALQGRVALDPVDLVLLHEELEALRVFCDDLVLAVEDGGIIDPGIVDFDALFGGMHEAVPHFRGVQQRLGRDAADVQTRAAQLGILLDEGGLETVLAGAEGSAVSAGPTADNDQVVGHLFSF